MGSFNLLLRPKAGAGSKPGSTIHKPLNDPRVIKHTIKAEKTDREVLIEGVTRMAVKYEEKKMLNETAERDHMGQDIPIFDPASAAQTDITMTDFASNNVIFSNSINNKNGNNNYRGSPAVNDNITTAELPTHKALNKAKVKYTPKAVRTSEDARIKRAVLEEKKCRYQQQLPYQQRLPYNGNGPTAGFGLSNRAGRRVRKSFILKDYMPKVGMVYPVRKSKSKLLGQKWQRDAAVLRALWSQRDTGDKRVLQALITPVFDQAVFKINLEGDVPEDNYSYRESQEEDIRTMWNAFLKELWYEFPDNTWVRKLRKPLFVRFFSLLADARLREGFYHKGDGREHPNLVRAITSFLDAAVETGTPWVMAYMEEIVENSGENSGESSSDEGSDDDSDEDGH
ncbi:hypothetical protein VMCG_08635 [Cytospora schulzeri]|uniref:Uncharacterized protein n=1 Tax=Cytospora schulzeri TaxID=448051 RepID=A0A423VT87_9PEZI|nr:hypothetical protein VMCG_08635 [Valsa malicola]